jgi:hypothetical protein
MNYLCEQGTRAGQDARKKNKEKMVKKITTLTIASPFYV